MFTFLVWASTSTSTSSPAELGRVQAPDLVTARQLAAAQWGGPLVVQSAASAALSRAEKEANPRHRGPRR